MAGGGAGDWADSVALTLPKAKLKADPEVVGFEVSPGRWGVGENMGAGADADGGLVKENVGAVG
jgi:hypothetical protein